MKASILATASNYVAITLLKIRPNFDISHMQSRSETPDRYGELFFAPSEPRIDTLSTTIYFITRYWSTPTEYLYGSPPVAIISSGEGLTPLSARK